ncbi:unnamed protein product [Cuscuta epithymum]|uniref:Chloroplast envelope membrane protein n=1 Tax=Cuscuta epithymum TaxID=186058 RepID=A0AAV0EZ68_9ASTE|nr:unnamed protein product [Cuscuta epithymum]
MSTSTISCPNPVSLKRPTLATQFFLGGSTAGLTGCRSWKRSFQKLIPQVKKRKDWQRSWWKSFFDEKGNWFGLKDDYMPDEVEFEESLTVGDDLELSEKEKFEAWKQRAEAIVELREAQEDIRNEENRSWEDWLVDPTTATTTIDSNRGSSWEQNSNGSIGNYREGSMGDDDPSEVIPLKKVAESVRAMVFGGDDDDILYEDRVIQYASINSAKFLAVLIIVPWSMDFLVHDYVLMPFLDRYVKTVPLAAEMLDVRASQKRELVKELKLEKARYRFEVEIGKSPSLSDKDLYTGLREKVIEMRDERRLENRREFANIWSDAVFGISLLILLSFNQSKVALLKFTGYKIINNTPDVGKAFSIILLADIFLGYHSSSGWETLLEAIAEHYGLDVDKDAITIFVCIVPVAVDAYFKIWLYKFLPRLSPKVATLLREVKRH